VKGDRSSTSSLLPYTAASSFGILPHCQAKEEVYLKQLILKIKRQENGSLAQNDATPPKKRPTKQMVQNAACSINLVQLR
jgi:hypothetical protein